MNVFRTNIHFGLCTTLPDHVSNCDELETPYRGKNWYGDPNSSQVAQLLGFPYDPRSSYLAIKVQSIAGISKGSIARKAGYNLIDKPVQSLYGLVLGRNPWG